VLGQETVTGRNNSESIAVEEVTDLCVANVLATTRPGDTSEDERSTIGLENNDDFLLFPFSFHARLCDETVLLQKIADALLDLGPWSATVGVTAVLSIANASEEIADGVSE
jgi:hypothetical protein